MSAAFDLSYGGAKAPTITLVDQIDRGLPLSVIDQLAGQVAPDDRNFKYNFVSRPTYARRKAQGPTARLSITSPEMGRSSVPLLARISPSPK